MSSGVSSSAGRALPGGIVRLLGILASLLLLAPACQGGNGPAPTPRAAAAEGGSSPPPPPRAAAPTAAATVASTTGPTALPRVAVSKSPTCGCCSKWVTHMRQAGFDVETTDIADRAELAALKERSGIPRDATSCHTAFVGPYVVEGHVPADVVKDLLDQAPAGVRGLIVPHMPAGSPGMESPNPQPYEVLALAEDGSTTVFARR